jgi:hypothetical protein
MSPREQPHPSGDSADFGDRVPSQSSLTSLERSTKGVAFGAVSVRVYERIVGDHPGTLPRFFSLFQFHQSRMKGNSSDSRDTSELTFSSLVSPDVKVGPPISIGWSYNELPEQHLDEYEKSQPTKRRNLRLSSITRRNLLINTFEVDEKEIRRAEREVARIQRQREETMTQGKAREIVETAVQSTKRKLRRSFSRESFLKGLSAASGAMLPVGMTA